MDGRETSSAAEAHQRRVAVVVVHGVGDVGPGETMSYIADAVIEKCPDLHEINPEVRAVSRIDLEQPESPLTRAGDTFPVSYQRVALPDGGEAMFYETYWADLARQRRGWFATLVGMLRFVFEIPHVIDSLLRRPPGYFSWLMRQLVLIVTVLVRGPLAAVSAVMLAGGLSFLVYAYIPEREAVSELINGILGRVFMQAPGEPALFSVPALYPVTVHFLLVMSVIALFAFWVFGRTFKRNAGWADLGICVFAVVVLLIADLTFIAPEILQLRQPSEWHAINSSNVHFALNARYYPLIEMIWVLWAFAMAGVFGLLCVLGLVSGLQWGRGLRGAGLAVALAVLQATVWLTLLSAISVLHVDSVLCSEVAKGRKNVAINSANTLIAPRNDTTLVALSCQDRINRNQRVEALLQTVDAERSRLPVEVGDIVREELQERRQPLDADMLRAYKELSQSFLYNGTVLFGLVGLAVLVVLYRRLRTSMWRSDHSTWAERIPRMIVNKTLLLWLLGAGALNVFFIVGFFFDRRTREALPPEIVAMGAVGVLTAYFALRLLWAVLRVPVAGVMHIAQDLIDHQYRRRVGLTSLWRVGLSSRYVRRERIEDRLNSILDTFVMPQGFERGGFDDVIFLTHSQGTVIALDSLRSKAGMARAEAGFKPHIVTTGSPLLTLYGYYFDEYKALETDMSELDGRYATWVNLYRSDDPIGGRIGPPGGGPVENVAMAPGGHVLYWEEEPVYSVVYRLLTGVSRRHEAAAVS